MFKINELCFSYPDKTFSLSIPDLSFKKGEITALIGGNGSGKTTLFRMLAGVFKPDKGNYQYQGVQSNIVADLPCKVVMHNAFGTLSESHTILQSCQLVSSLYGVNESNQLIRDIAERIGMSNSLDKKIHELSSGQKQKAMLLRTLTTDPDVVLLDEPTTALDVIAIESTIEWIKQLKDLGKIVIISTHHPYELMELKPSVIGLSHGTVSYENKTLDPNSSSEQLRTVIKDIIR